MNEQRRERYMRDSFAVRLGNLSSSLGRLADAIAHPERRDMAIRMMDECRWFIEWTGAEAEPDVAVELVRLQLMLTIWRRRYLAYPTAAMDETAATEARKSADKVLAWSGLLAD